jgi:hypothetical protein
VIGFVELGRRCAPITRQVIAAGCWRRRIVREALALDMLVGTAIQGDA